MARWTDLATWRGPSPNVGGPMVEVRGVVVHIAEGFYEGTIAWQRNRNSRVSSHFVTGREPGELAQVVDTSVTAWTQGAGNGHWLSIENAGFTKGHHLNPGGWEKLTGAQIEMNAQILAKAHLVHGVPLVVADHPGEKGLGHHSMDREWLGEQWGHDACPGAPIIAQKAAIVARAHQIAKGDDDMPTVNEVWNTDGIVAAPQGYDAEKNPHWTAANVLRSAHLYSRLGWQQTKAGHKAILAAVGGLDTDAILAAIDRRATEDAARDAALLELVEQGQSGQLAADEVVRLIGERLTAEAG